MKDAACRWRHSGAAGVTGSRRRERRGLVTFEESKPRADVLVVTSGWPRPDNPTHCVFIRRQMESLGDEGVCYEALFIHGYRSRFAYGVAAARLVALNFCGRKYRLVHAHGGEAALVACFYRRAPLLISYLGGDLLGNSYRPDGYVTAAGQVRRWIIRQTSRCANETITKSREMADVLPAPVRARNNVIPNGVDPDVFRPMDRSSAREALGWRPDERVALFVGDPNELRKRHSLAVAGVEEAASAVPDLRLAVVHGVEPQRTPVYMNAADCLLHLSWMEGSPNVVKEALMCDLPVVATAVGDIPELLKEVEPSFLVDPRPEAVARALVACLHSPNRSNGRKQSRRLTAGAVAALVLEVYRRLAGGTPGI